MKTANATLSDFRQSPRKMRGVANLMRGKKVSEALVHLDFVGKRAALPIKNLLVSALANAKNLEIKPENLVIKTITVNVGKTLKRHRPVSHGSAHPIHKRTSHIFIELGEGKTKK
jgi:large subunit ribosomal protein L22